MTTIILVGLGELVGYFGGVKKAFENADSSSRVELIPSKIKYAIKVVLSFHKEFSVFLSLSRKENDGLLQDQRDFQAVYAISLTEKPRLSLDNLVNDLGLLFKTIIRCIPGPKIKKDGSLQIFATSTKYDENKGKIAIPDHMLLLSGIVFTQADEEPVDQKKYLEDSCKPKCKAPCFLQHKTLRSYECFSARTLVALPWFHYDVAIVVHQLQATMSCSYAMEANEEVCEKEKPKTVEYETSTPITVLSKDEDQEHDQAVNMLEKDKGEDDVASAQNATPTDVCISLPTTLEEESKENEKKNSEEEDIKDEYQENEKEIDISEKSQSVGKYVTSSQNVTNKDIKETKIMQHVTAVAYSEEGPGLSATPTHILKEETEDKLIDV
nr:putative elongation factor TypA-like SVR3, chloroplastic [Tanacetum cinerariifolium]